MLFRGIQDIVSNLPQGPPSTWLQAARIGGYDAEAVRGTVKSPAGSGRRSDKPRLGAAPATASFEEAWAVYRSANPRLRDPRVLPELLRRCGPDTALRGEVWLHCLGVDSAAIAAMPIGLGQPAKKCDCQLEEQSPEQQEQDSIGVHTDETPSLGQRGVSSDAPADDAVTDAMSPTAASQPSAETALPWTPDEDLPEGLADLIDADVLRTFATSEEFAQMGGPMSLRRVLRQFAVMDTELGYTQSLNFIAAVFITVLHDERAALCAVRQLLVKLGTKSWYTDGMRQLRADTFVLEELVRERMPSVHEAFVAHKFELLFVTSKWFLCLFATTLEGEALRRVWDVMLCDGIEAVIRVSFVLIARRAEAAAKARSIDDLIHTFQDSYLEASPAGLIKDAYDPSLVGQIGKADLSQRRQTALKKVSSDDTRAEMRNQQLWRGGVRPASVLARQ